MMNEHLSDEQLQEFVLDPSACEPGIGEHVQLCELCQTKVEAYRVVIAAIEEQRVPAFDFDISDAVLATIDLQKRKEKYWWMFILIATGVLFTGVAVYLFIDDITILFQSIGTFLTYLIILTGVFILVAVVIDMLKTYKTKMHMLDILK